jgi:hypothetical protein
MSVLFEQEIQFEPVATNFVLSTFKALVAVS